MNCRYTVSSAEGEGFSPYLQLEVAGLFARGVSVDVVGNEVWESKTADAPLFGGGVEQRYRAEICGPTYYARERLTLTTWCGENRISVRHVVGSADGGKVCCMCDGC